MHTCKSVTGLANIPPSLRQVNSASANILKNLGSGATELNIKWDGRIALYGGREPDGTFVLGGRAYHRIGSLLPCDGAKHCFSQIWTLDTDDATGRRQELLPRLSILISSVCYPYPWIPPTGICCIWRG